ncbi:MAG: hypothetical protein QXX34_03505 [Candidatus Bathyarchaeia archaeon]
MSLPKKKYDIEMQTLQTLSQKLASKSPELADYACNLNADKLAILDLYIKAYEAEDEEFVNWLKGLRAQLKVQGEALWIMNADVLTNLGLKVGKTGVREIGGKRSEAAAGAAI